MFDAHIMMEKNMLKLSDLFAGTYPQWLKTIKIFNIQYWYILISSLGVEYWAAFISG